MPPTFQEVTAGVGEGVEDNARAGITDVQNKYQEFLTGRPAPLTAPTGEMERSSGPEEAEPMSYGAALRKHSDMEQAEIRAKHEAEQAKAAPEQDTSYNGPEL